jgi:hypothetical protein
VGEESPADLVYTIPVRWLPPTAIVFWGALGVGFVISNWFTGNPPLWWNVAWLAFVAIAFYCYLWLLPWQVTVHEGRLIWRAYLRTRVVAISDLTGVRSSRRKVRVLTCATGERLLVWTLGDYSAFEAELFKRQPALAAPPGTSTAGGSPLPL